MSTTKGTRPIDANDLARRIREYMDDFLNATTRLATWRAILSMLGDENQTPTLRPITREQVEKMRGEWRECFEDWREQIAGNQCSKCGFQNYGTSINHYHFCPACGSPMTGEAVEMTLKRLEEALKDGKND